MRGTARDRDIVQVFALVVGATFLVVGILGFIPGITSNLYGGLDFAGHDSNAKLLHVFQVSWLHNLVHIGYGIAGLLLARTWETARAYLIGGGIVYLVLWLYGLIVSQNSGANFVPVNTADNWLHFVLGLGMITLGFVTTRDRRTAASAAT